MCRFAKVPTEEAINIIAGRLYSRTEIWVVVKNYGPFSGPYYNTAPII